MSYQCKFCNAVLASEYSLSTHQKKLKNVLLNKGYQYLKENLNANYVMKNLYIKRF